MYIIYHHISDGILISKNKTRNTQKTQKHYTCPYQYIISNDLFHPFQPAFLSQGQAQQLGEVGLLGRCKTTRGDRFSVAMFKTQGDGGNSRKAMDNVWKSMEIWELFFGLYGIMVILSRTKSGSTVSVYDESDESHRDIW